MASTTTESKIADNLGRIERRMADACDRSGRTPDSVKLVAVVKYAELPWVEALLAQGVADLGESRPQQLLERIPLIDGGVRWHLVGHLQRNKARKVLPAVSLVHSVDSFRLLTTLERLAGELELTPNVLLQVNVAGETAKHGFDPEELRNGWDTVTACERVQVEGLMAMAPYADDPEASRPVFRHLRELRDRLRDDALPLSQLSMGMSRDFEPAVEEGATVVRIGSGLFEGLERDRDRA